MSFWVFLDITSIIAAMVFMLRWVSKYMKWLQGTEENMPDKHSNDFRGFMISLLIAIISSLAIHV
jgi:hypothetical protein